MSFVQGVKGQCHLAGPRGAAPVGSRVGVELHSPGKGLGGRSPLKNYGS